MNIRKLLSSFHFRVIFALALLSAYLVLIWLPGGKIIAGGDVGIPVWAPSKQLAEVATSWWESHATGITSPITYTAVPFYLMLSILEKIGLSPDIAQKALFFFVLVGGSTSIYFLALNFNFVKKGAALAAIFYILNLTALSVWQRSVHNAILVLFLAPVSLLLLVRGIQNQKYTSIIWINIVSFFSTYVYGALGYLFSIWLLWMTYIIVSVIYEWKDKERRKFLLKYTAVLIISWIGCNLWWMLHFLRSTGFTLGEFTPEELKQKGSSVLLALKPYHEPAYILRGLSRFYHYGAKDWGNFYLNPLVILLSWIPTVIIFSTALFKSNYKLVQWRFLFILTILALLFSKGVNPPLGWLNKIPYDFLPVLAPLRNPYEKIGILLVIPFSLLFSLGVYQIAGLFKSGKSYLLKSLLFIAVVICLTVLVWPLWLGKLFVSEGRKYLVTVPDYYSEANNWLKDKLDDTRILHLPLASGESTDYNWGYTGVEPSQYFFNGSSVGYQLSSSSIDSRIKDLIVLFHKQDTPNIIKAMASLNIGWIIVHNETVWRDRGIEPVERINAWVNANPQVLEYQKDFGPLSVSRVKDEYRLGHFFTSGKLAAYTALGIPQANKSLKAWNQIQSLNESFLINPPPNLLENLDNLVSKKIFLPKKKFSYSDFLVVDTDTAIKQIAKVKHLPDSAVYPFVRLKEKIHEFLNQSDPGRNCFILSGKKLVESVMLKRSGKSELLKNALEDYDDQLVNCSQIDRQTISGYLSAEATRQEILSQLIGQRFILEQEFKNYPFADQLFKTKESLNEFIADLGIYPKYSPKYTIPSDKEVMIFTYLVPEDGNYSIKIDGGSEVYDQYAPFINQIDSELVESPASVNLTKGYHEIHLRIAKTDNLIKESVQQKQQNPDPGFKTVPDPDTGEQLFLGEAVNIPINLIFDIGQVDIEQTYRVLFDIQIMAGQIPEVLIFHDSDPIDASGKIKPAVRIPLLFTSYPLIWRNLGFTYSSALNATSAKMAFNLGSFKIPTIVAIKNVKVEKVFSSDIILENLDRKETKDMGSAVITWQKLNPTKYELNIKDQKTPYILVFSETFHPLWKILDSSGRTIDLPHFSIDGFANAWLVENPLPEKIKVKFVLQDSRNMGIFISAISFAILVIIGIFLDKQERKNA